VFKIFDLHCDSAQNLLKGDDLSKVTRHHVDLPKLRKGGFGGVVWACWVSPKEKEPFLKALELVDSSLRFVEQHARWFSLAKSWHQLRADRINVILGVEGGHIFDETTVQFKTLHRLGVRVYTLTWNNSNRLAHSALDNDRLGLTRLGREYIKLMGKSGVLVDLSHSSTRTTLDVCRELATPPIASHSCLRGLKQFARNISDRALRAIGSRGGVCGVNFSGYHLGKSGVVEHIMYIKRQTSIHTAAIGSDFDGISDPVLPHAGHIQKLVGTMLGAGLSGPEIEKVCGGNFLRVFKQVC